MASRLSLIADAVRPKMSAIALIQAPQGAGKTWTALSIARRFVAGTDGKITLLDTERESALTYADVFSFQHLPWRAPFDPAELTTTLDEFDRQCIPDDVLIIDSASHFWQGPGGILDIAGGRVQGGWDKARPIQNALVEQILGMRCHVFLCARMKNTVEVTNGGKTVESIGLTVIQDDTLAYEVNIVVQMAADHSITVLKSRTPAVPVGRLYPGGHEDKLAADYEEWLAGGIPPANREDVDRIKSTLGGIADKEVRIALKNGFITEFGSPESLTAEQVPAVYQWLKDNDCPIDQGPAAATQTDPTPELEAGQDAPPLPSSDAVDEMSKPVAVALLRRLELPTSGSADDVRGRLYGALIELEAGTDPAADVSESTDTPPDSPVVDDETSDAQTTLDAEIDAQAATGAAE